MQPTTPIPGVAAALALLSGVAGAAVQIYTPSSPIVSTSYAMTINPISTVVTHNFNGLVTFCLGNGFNGMMTPGNDVYEVLYMPGSESFETSRLGGDQEIGDSTIGSDDYAYIDFDGYTSDEKFFIGFSFQQTSEDPRYYGWAEVSVAEDGKTTLYRFAYEDQGWTPIVTPVPEPGAATLTATGLALALLGSRRRRQQA